MRSNGFLLLTALLTVSLLTSVASAQDDMVEESPLTAPWYASLTLGAIHFEGDEELEAGLLTSLRLGYDVNERWTFEGLLYLTPELSANTDEFPKQADASLTSLAFDGLFHFTRWDRLDPYLAAGFGFTHYSEELEDGNQDDVTLRGGGGVMYHFNDEWAIRADFRGMLAGFGESPNANSMYDAGVIWTWGARVPFAGMAYDEDPDKDGDGLLDREEIEIGTDPYHPDTDRDRLLDGEEVRQYHTDPLNPDTDGDLLKDGAEVADHRTEPTIADTDGGGVTDGHEVLEDSTNPRKGHGDDDLVLYTLNIEFDTSKAEVKARYAPQIDIIAKVLIRNPAATARIEGHADKRRKSKRSYNLDLSEKRAKAVRQYLISKGKIDKDRLTAEGFGFDRPLPGEINDPKMGNQHNRRVEVYISGVGDKSNLPILPEVQASDF